MSRRSKGRECALQIMYDADISQDGLCKEGLGDTIKAYWENFTSDGASHSYVEGLVYGVVNNLQEIDNYITDASPRWKIDRMATVDRNVLRLGIYELLQKEVVPAIIINEAVELAKKFGAEQSSAFVNGLLDEIRRVIEAKK